MSGDMVVVVAALVLAAFAFGLYWGERGRRQAAERWKTTGSPDAHQPEAVSVLPAGEPEDRFQEAVDAASKETIERGVEQLMAEAQAAGIRVDEDQIRRDVEQMVTGEDVTG